MQNVIENCAEQSATPKEIYVKPQAEIVNLELEQPILAASAPNFGNGGQWGR